MQATSLQPAPVLEQRKSGQSPFHLKTVIMTMVVISSSVLGNFALAWGMREAAPDALLVGEVYQPTQEYARYLEALDLVFAFELLFAPWDAARLRAAIEPAAALGRVAWVMSNHDFDRLASRVGQENVRAAAELLLTLPGPAFIFQGDEIGLPNGPGADPPLDRAGRDPMRHPMQWNASPNGGFTTGEPWLPLVDPHERNVETQAQDPSSLLNFFRQLIESRRTLGEDFRMLSSRSGLLSYERDGWVVTIEISTE